MNILIAPDKFKGTLTAPEAARAMARGWRKARPHDRLVLLPMSDGGDGFGAILGRLIGARRMSCLTVDAAHRPCRAAWWWQASKRTAIIESAGVIGLADLPTGKFHPFQLDTAGLTKVFLAAHGRGAKQIIVGIGGSATNDGGFGMARSLGWQFLDRRGKTIERWTQLDQLAAAIRPKLTPSCEVSVAVDVRNHLLGATGRAGFTARRKDCVRQTSQRRKLACGGWRRSSVRRSRRSPGPGRRADWALAWRHFLVRK